MFELHPEAHGGLPKKVEIVAYLPPCFRDETVVPPTEHNDNVCFDEQLIECVEIPV